VNVQRIKDKLTNGFKPFILYTSGGRRFRVPHPEFIAIGQGVVVVIDNNDRVHTLDALHITQIEDSRPKR
jgi:hypothetical protein